jgi:hypothetical protein
LLLLLLSTTGIETEATTFVAGVLQGLRNFDPNLRETMNDTCIYDLVDSDHGRVLQVVHPMD